MQVLNHKTCPSVGNASSFADRLNCTCAILGGVPRDYSDRQDAYLAQNYGRSLCRNLGSSYSHLEGVPLCFYRKSWAANENHIAKGFGLKVTKARVDMCFSDYYNAAKASYGCTDCGYGAEPPFDAGFAWQLARIAKGSLAYTTDDNPEDDFNSMAYCGQNVHVFVIDTGINRRHPDLMDRIGDGVNLIDPGNPKSCKFSTNTMSLCEDANGHGTHVAGSILGQVASVADGGGITDDGLLSAATPYGDVVAQLEPHAIAGASKKRDVPNEFRDAVGDVVTELAEIGRAHV